MILSHAGTEQRVKILHLITGLGFGGAETMLANVVCGLDPARFQNKVISLTDAGVYGPSLAAAGVEVVPLRMTRGIPSWRAWRQLRQCLHAEVPDVVQTWMYHADVLGLVATLDLKTTALVWNLRCTDMDFARYRRLTAWIVRLLARTSMRPYGVVVNSEAGRRHHISLGYLPRRWEVIPNGFDTTKFKPDSTAARRICSELGFPAETPLVGMVARVDPMKDHETFLRAATLLKDLDPKPAFVMIGAGTEALAPHIAAHGLTGTVRVLGARSDVARFMPAFSLLALSSISEGFPNVLGEAMAAGVCCVATDTGDVRSIVGDTGWVVPPRDPAALADGMREALGLSPQSRAVRGAAARQRIVDHYALETIIQKYDALYSAAAESVRNHH